MKIPNQEKIWDEISTNWKTFRVVPVKEAVDFIKKCKGNVLDLGCGSGRNFVKIPGKIYGVDFSKKQLKYSEESANKNKMSLILKKARAEKLPFKDNFFDKIICIATIHCIDSEKKREKALQEILRVLKKGGEALITIWNKDQEKFKKEPKEIMIAWSINNKKLMRYYYLYDKKEISHLVTGVGFKIIKILDKANKDSKYSKRNILVYVKKP
ncbi:methyltransferase domain-containing protein [Candidatus Pacearchaeota archaeon]|nr:methyltransferase domain-containing protein [Candidatus Pacearchaeota archaeon]